MAVYTLEGRRLVMRNDLRPQLLPDLAYFRPIDELLMWYGFEWIGGLTDVCEVFRLIANRSETSAALRVYSQALAVEVGYDDWHVVFSSEASGDLETVITEMAPIIDFLKTQPIRQTSEVSRGEPQ